MNLIQTIYINTLIQKKMAAAKGNKYAAGYYPPYKPRAYATPELFKEACENYFDWIDQNPIIKNEAIKSGLDAGRIIQIPTQRPYLIEGLCDHLGISYITFLNYESKEEYKEYFSVCAYVRQRIYRQNLEYGYSGAFDAGLVARKLGIADKKEMDARIQTPVIVVKNDDEKKVISDLLDKE